ncbi:MAG: 5-methylcytosine-specific restriction endonuclease system specificity protein McrC [Ruminococcus sp.]|nr:5-methylcytosine-specific restriction endonuclease system specificity protein McrC [Ruminococcus sp.]
MTNDKGIFIQNIYYMLSYAFQILKQDDYQRVATEDFEHIQDLFSAILAKGVARQLKQGLHREYIDMNESLSVLRGKLNISGTIHHKLQHKQQLACEYDELSEDNTYNQILKTTMNLLICSGDVKQERKSEIKKLMIYFDNVTTVPITSIKWNMLIYQRNNRNYELLLNICYLIIKGMLQTTEDGNYSLASFSDDHMARLYERFILEYYKQHHSELSAEASQVKWNIVGEHDDTMIQFLPTMQTDITLRKGGRTLIIDAKYYGKTLSKFYDKSTLHSANLYQIFTYVKNEDKGNTGDVSGLLLYAKTEELVVPNCRYNIGGNSIGARTLDLNQQFPMIAKQLDEIADYYLG